MMFRIPDGLHKWKWPALFFLWVIHGVVALGEFTSGDSFEFSPVYVTISFFLLLWIVLNVLAGLSSPGYIPRLLVWRDFLKSSNARDVVFVTAFLLVIVRVGIWYVRGLFDSQLRLQFGGYFDILEPLLILMGYVSFELLLVIAFFNFDCSSEASVDLKKFLIRISFVLLGLCILVIVISKTRLGLDPSYKGDWERGLPAVPLLEWQIILAVLLCLTMFFYERRIREGNFRSFDILICIGIWAAASICWLGQPVIPHPSALTPHAPNFEIYPFIDSQTYDELSQSILIGDGFGREQIPQRPLYIVFLVFVHMLGGQDYGNLVFIQTLFFAFFPVLLFVLGRDLFGRPIGISIAFLAILRDYTSNIVSPFTGNLSYSKVFLSEIPTAMLLLLFLIVGIRWMKSGFPIFLSIVLGGILGSAMLIRTQAVVLVPVIILFSILSQPVNMKALVKGTMTMLLLSMVVISPWLWRNWNITGDLIFDNPESQTMNLALRYSRVNGVDWQVERLPGETSAEFSARLKRIATDAILSNPSGAAWALTNTFVNHGVNNILLFPLRDEIKSFDELRFPAEAFWEKWTGFPTPSQRILLGFYIFLFGLGVTVAWQRGGWLGLLPLGLNLIYNLWTSIALLSGQRFMLTMDWSIYFYYMIGLFALAGCFLFTLNGTRTRIVEWSKNDRLVLVDPLKQDGWNKIFLASLLFFGIGLLPAVAEHIFPERYPQLPQGELIASLAKSSALKDSPVDSACFKRLVDQENLDIAQGRALYPRYYEAGDGEDFTDTPGYKVVDKDRLVFDVIGQRNQRVIFPLQESPAFFPHASDVTLVYNADRELWFILVHKDQKESFYISDNFDRSLCDP